jgi:bacillithiol biosynthesis cysteine-adding enzyme BshC
LQIKSIDYSHLPFSDLFRSYVTDYSKVERFYNGNPLNEDEISGHYKKNIPIPNRNEIVKLLKDFNKEFDLDSPAQKNIERLADNKAQTVVTGQQLGMYGGPLFTVYKALTAIVFAKRLEKMTGNPVVPVFWLADEDHDYEEIARVQFPNRDTIHSIKLDAFNEKDLAVSELVIPDRFMDFRNKVKENLRETDFSDLLWDLLDECYRPGVTFRVAFGKLISRLFSKHGMILAGSHDKNIKRYLLQQLQSSVKNASEIGEALENQSRKLAGLYHQQAKTDASLLFIHNDEGRIRISFDDGIWKYGDKDEWSSEELIKTIEKNPERFSPNVFFRPILQDVLLPNKAYVAGPGELAYYGQMKTIYPLFNLEMPFIIPRMSATLVESSISRIMDDLPFDFTAYNKRVEDLESDYVDRTNTMDVNEYFNQWKKEVNELSENKTEAIQDIDQTLKGAAEKATSSYYHALDGLKGKVFRAIKQQNDIQIKRIRKIHTHLFPEQELQERQFSFIYYMNKYGVDIWDTVLNMIEEETFDTHKLINI